MNNRASWVAAAVVVVTAFRFAAAYRPSFLNLLQTPSRYDDLAVEVTIQHRFGGIIGEPQASSFFDGADHPLIVVRVSETQVNAFSSRCTHAGCKVNPPSDGRAVCPCHNAVFDTAGGRISALAFSTLKRYSASINGAVITISV